MKLCLTLAVFFPTLPLEICAINFLSVIGLSTDVNGRIFLFNKAPFDTHSSLSMPEELFKESVY